MSPGGTSCIHPRFMFEGWPADKAWKGNSLMSGETKLTKDDIKYLQSMVRDDEKSGPWLHVLDCLPANDDKLYQVFRHEGADAEWVPAQNIQAYPWIAINSVWVPEDEGPREEITPGYFRGVNGQGVALVALDVTEPVAAGSPIYLKPTIICRYENRWHYLYRLKKFLPGPGTSRPASPESLVAFCNAVSHLETATGGRYIFGDPILNPSADRVHTEFAGRVFRFADLKKAHLSPDELESIRREGKRRQSEAARRTSAIRVSKSIAKIIKAIEGLKASGMPVNQIRVTNAIPDLSRSTVIRHWQAPKVKKARGE